MRKVITGAAIVALALSMTPANAAGIAAGQKCVKLGQKSSLMGVTFQCVKTGSKLTWKAVVKAVPAAAEPTPTPTPTPSASPSASSTTEPAKPVVDTSIADLWVRYGWKSKSRSEITTASTKEFSSYIATKRNPDQVVTVLAQDGANATLVDWIKRGATLVAQSFAYPKLSGPFYDVIGLDATWLEKTYRDAGFSDQEVKDRLGGWNAGAPAFGGTRTNTWNSKTIVADNLMSRDKVGMAQTAGHEFFHAIQENSAKTNPGPKGELIPNWFWEGPATFVGVNAAVSLGIYPIAEGEQAFIDRYRNGAPINRSSNLIDIKANDGKVDPYALGFAASELIVANVGVEKFVNIYNELGKGKTFAAAFESATGVPLADFYTMFEQVRSDLGYPKS